jgi:anti-sigma factor ChrR (cupin superfamily)
MKSKSILILAASFVVAAAVFAQEPAKAKAHAAPKAGTPVFMAAADLKWADLSPTGAPGVKIADVWGDHTKSGYGAFLKFPAGFLAPLHTHTSAIKIVVISGTYIQTPEGKAEMRMGPGSYVFQPGGSYKHISACDKASECLLFIESTGKFDLKPVEAAKAPK